MASYAPIQTATGQYSGSGPTSPTIPSTTTGTSLFLGIEFDTIFAPPAAPTGWTLLTDYGKSFNTDNQCLAMYYKFNNAGGITSFTIPSGSYTRLSWTYAEIPITTAALDKQSPTITISSYNTGFTVATGSGNTNAGELVIMIYGANPTGSSGQTMTVSSSTPVLTSGTAYTDGSTNMAVGMFYGTSGSSGESDTATTTSASSVGWMGLMATFSGTAPAGTSTQGLMAALT
jgi:hypothetical protein